jgi:hypothetical protein
MDSWKKVVLGVSGALALGTFAIGGYFIYQMLEEKKKFKAKEDLMHTKAPLIMDEVIIESMDNIIKFKDVVAQMLHDMPGVDSEHQDKVVDMLFEKRNTQFEIQEI